MATSSGVDRGAGSGDSNPTIGRLFVGSPQGVDISASNGTQGGELEALAAAASKSYRQRGLLMVWGTLPALAAGGGASNDPLGESCRVPKTLSSVCDTRSLVEHCFAFPVAFWGKPQGVVVGIQPIGYPAEAFGVVRDAMRRKCVNCGLCGCPVATRDGRRPVGARDASVAAETLARVLGRGGSTGPSPERRQGGNEGTFWRSLERREVR